MARQDTIAGFYNYPVTLSSYGVTGQTALLAPTASGVYSGLPSPAFPLSTSTYPTVLYVSVPPDIAGGELDGHPFEVKIAGEATGPAGTSTLTMKLFQATAAVIAGGTSSTAYGYMTAIPPSGTGVNSIAVGSAITLSTSVKTNFAFSVPLIWDSTSKQLNLANLPYFYAVGSSVYSSATASTASIGQTDLNFFPTFAFGTTAPTALTITEFVINRL